MLFLIDNTTKKLYCDIGREERRGMFLHTYKSSSGRDLIMEYIDSLTEPERVDAFSVLECTIVFFM